MQTVYLFKLIIKNIKKTKNIFETKKPSFPHLMMSGLIPQLINKNKNNIRHIYYSYVNTSL